MQWNRVLITHISVPPLKQIYIKTQNPKWVPLPKQNGHHHEERTQKPNATTVVTETHTPKTATGAQHSGVQQPSHKRHHCVVNTTTKCCQLTPKLQPQVTQQVNCQYPGITRIPVTRFPNDFSETSSSYLFYPR